MKPAKRMLTAICIDEKEVNTRNKLSSRILLRRFFLMSKGERGTFFAVGLVAGVALALFFFVWAYPWFSDPTQQPRYCAPNDRECAEQYEKPGDSHFWVRPFHGWLYAEDSLAQWLMAGFGILGTGVSLWAVILLRETLEATRDAVNAAREANDILVDQMRPWLVLDREVKCDFYLSDTSAGFAWRFEIKNHTQTPALSTTVTDELMFFESTHEFITAFRIFVERCRGQSEDIGGSPIFVSKGGDDKSWSRRLYTVRRQTMYHGLFVCMTYRYRNKIGIDAQAFLIREDRPDYHGPMNHKLIAYDLLRVIE